MTRSIRILILFLIAPLLLFACALTLIWLPLPPPFPAAASTSRNQMAAILTGILALVFLFGLAIWLVTIIARSSRVFDPAFAEQGLIGQYHWPLGRRYHGSIEGRTVEVIYVPGRVLQHALLTLSVGAKARTRMAIGTKKPLLRHPAFERVQTNEADVDHLTIFAGDSEWVQSLLSDPQNRVAISHLLAEQIAFGLRELYTQPDAVWLRARPTPKVSADQVQTWLESLIELAKMMEKY